MFKFTKKRKISPTSSPEPSTPLHLKCNHTIVQDHIDLTPDTSQVIYYCSNCLSTFLPKGNEFVLQYANEGSPPFH